MHWSRPERTEGFGESGELCCRVPAQVSQTWGRSDSLWQKTKPSEFRTISHRL